MAKDKANKTVEGENPLSVYSKKEYVIAQRFRDLHVKDKYLVHEVDEPAHFEGERLAELIEKGFVKEK